MNLSKSKYTRFCQCPKMLWLDTYRPELAIQDLRFNVDFRKETSRRFGHGILGDFVETTAYCRREARHPFMLKNTKKYLLEGKRISVRRRLPKTGAIAPLISYIKRRRVRDLRSKIEYGYHDVYLWDVAYQRWVLEQSGLKIVQHISFISTTSTRGRGISTSIDCSQ